MKHGARRTPQTILPKPSLGVAARQASDAAYVLLVAVLPIGMVVANKSAALVICLAAGAACLAALLASRASDQPVAAVHSARRLALSIAGIAAFAGLSAGLSVRPASGLDQAVQILAPLVATALLCVLLPRQSPPKWILPVAMIAFASALALITFELMTGMWMRRMLGVRDLTFVFNRSLVTLLLISWPLMAILAVGNRRRQAAALMAGLCLVTALSDSGATTLALAVSLLAFFGALWLRSAVRLALLAAVLIALVTAPWHGDIAAWLLGPRAVEAISSANAGERIRIWQAFGAMVSLQAEHATTTWFGYGFGSSRTLHTHPAALLLPQQMRALLEHGHPHNAFLQIATELGRVGIMLFAIGAVIVERAIARLDAPDQPYALALATACVAVAAVSHGAWQAWWIASIGAALAGFAALSAERRRQLLPPKDRNNG